MLLWIWKPTRRINRKCHRQPSATRKWTLSLINRSQKCQDQKIDKNQINGCTSSTLFGSFVPSTTTEFGHNIESTKSASNVSWNIALDAEKWMTMVHMFVNARILLSLIYTALCKSNVYYHLCLIVVIECNRLLVNSTFGLIARQANEKTPEKKNEESVKTATSKCKNISPAKADELAEAKKRMEAFLANKQNGKPVTSTITTLSAPNNVPAVQKKFVVKCAQVKKDEQSKFVTSNLSDFKTPQKPADGVECSHPKASFTHSQSVCSDKLMSALSDFQIEQVKNPEATRTVPEKITRDYNTNCFFSGVTVMVERPQLSRVESSDHETPEKLQVPVEDIIKVHYTDDFKKRFFTPTKFIASQVFEESEKSPYSSPMKPEPTPEPVMNVKNVISHTPSSVNWLEAQMTNLFGRQISISTSVPVVTQIVAPVVKRIPINLSHSICLNVLTTVLNEVWIKQNNEMLSRQNASMTIKEPDSLKSCVANPDCLLDKVPEYFSPVKTPCQTHVKMQFDKRIRPAVPKFSHKDVLRVRPIKLPFPKRIKKSVSFLDVFKSVPKQPTFDEVVNGGGSGFRILSN